MSSNLNDRLCETPGERRAFVLPQTPVERDLDRLAEHTYLDITAELPKPVDGTRTKNYPLTIYYEQRANDPVNLKVRVRTARNVVLRYQSSYLPLFQAVSFAHMLQSFFISNEYGCMVTKEIVKVES